MKTNILILFFATFIISSCSKKDATPTTPPTTDSYINTNAGSSWTYHEDDSSTATPKSSDYTITSTSSDTTINSNKYHIYSYSYGGSEYLFLSGNNYYQFDSIPGIAGSTLERLYLKDNAIVGDSWSQNLNLNIPNVPIPVSLTVTNKIAEKGISRTVNGTNYTNVIHVSTTLSSTLITSGFTSSIDSYYAPKYGLIENSTLIALNFMSIIQNVNIKTKLISASLK